jgi:hypothetical protein
MGIILLLLDMMLMTLEVQKMCSFVTETAEGEEGGVSNTENCFNGFEVATQEWYKNCVTTYDVARWRSVEVNVCCQRTQEVRPKHRPTDCYVKFWCRKNVRACRRTMFARSSKALVHSSRAAADLCLLHIRVRRKRRAQVPEEAIDLSLSYSLQQHVTRCNDNATVIVSFSSTMVAWWVEVIWLKSGASYYSHG